MVDLRAERVGFNNPEGQLRCGHRRIQVTFGPELFESIRKEAATRDWPMSRMIRHLCEASIEGIE